MISSKQEDKTQELLVFELNRPSQCSICKQDLFKGNIVKLEERGSEKLALCRPCAHLNHLHILRSGNAKITRLASKYSSVRWIILRWSSARKRYERQGILVEEQAIDRAERETGITLTRFD